ncbi:tRNA-methyltransferase-domain-containing protein [Hypoxylon fuscum]|nr:tRNA-methyltransferase-domain-containing protein [Hypoxylon fuscum]
MADIVPSDGPVGEVHGSRGMKRCAENDGDRIDSKRVHQGISKDDTTTQPPQMSKNQIKKQRKEEKRNEKRIFQKMMRQEKRKEKQAAKRDFLRDLAIAEQEGRKDIFLKESGHLRYLLPPRKEPKVHYDVPLTVMIDCQYEKYMNDHEIKSLGNQITRCYSDVRNATLRPNLYITSFEDEGKLRQRFVTVLKNQHLNWKNTRFFSTHFVGAAGEAKHQMMEDLNGDSCRIPMLTGSKPHDSVVLSEDTNSVKKKNAPEPEPEADDVAKEIVYLTADSPYVLNRLEPGCVYVVGGLIDRNREKGVCYKVAKDANVRTAKLPIDQYMAMQSRHVLATNHVVEILLAWLETGDWGEAFMKVLPKRKGGKLKELDEEEDSEVEEEDLEMIREAMKSNDTAIRTVDGEASKVSFAQVQQAITELEGDSSEDGDNSEEGLQTNSLERAGSSTPPIIQ